MGRYRDECSHTPLSGEYLKLGKEKRRFPRRAIRIDVDFRAREKGTFLFSRSRDISRGGIFIETGTPFRMGTDIIVVFRHPCTANELCVRGKVVWINPYMPESDLHDPPGMGITFRRLEEWEWEFILSIIKVVAYL